MELDRVMTYIEETFKDVSLEDGVGLSEARAYEDYADSQEILIAREQDRLNFINWQLIPDDILAKNPDALFFVDAKGLRFLLPAYMRYTLNHYKESLNVSESSIYALNRDPYRIDGWSANTFNSNQAACISRFLKWAAFDIGDTYFNADAALNAYTNWWSS